MNHSTDPNSADFDYGQFEKEAIEALQRGSRLGGPDGVLAPLLKRILEASLEGELSNHLSDPQSSSSPNRRNGKNKKQVKTSLGEIELLTPRDRNGSFEPTLVPKRKRILEHGLEEKILSLYGLGMSYQDIQAQLMELYGFELSVGKISAITDKVWPEVESWRNRQLESSYPFVWLDAMYYKIRKDGRVVTRCLYTVLGINMEGYKELLGVYVGEREGAKYWLQVLTDLKNRGIEDILFASIDNLTGFADAIETIFPHARVQLCIVHQIRNSMRYLTTEDTKPFMADLKRVYKAASRDKAESTLKELEEKWVDKYPIVINSWKNNWERLAEFFAYSPEIRKLMYTTNLIEGYHRQIRKATKTKGPFPNDKALLKLVFMTQRRITEKWSKPVHKWALIISQLAILFPDRVRKYLRI